MLSLYTLFNVKSEISIWNFSESYGKHNAGKYGVMI